MFVKEKHRTVFCLLVVTLFTSFFFARSVVVRDRWIVPTFMGSLGDDGTAWCLLWVNNWLKEGPMKLRFSSYNYPDTIETPTLDKRRFYASYPPGAVLPVYLLFKFLDFSGIVPEIYDKRGTQLLLITFYNYLQHFLLVLLLCGIVFVVCRKLEFDRLNSTLLAITPAIIQFHNQNSLYFHHQNYYHPILLLPFVAYIFLEILRITHDARAVRILQPIVMFWGGLTNYLFVILIITVYATRIIRKEICLPISLQKGLHWARQSFLFFTPLLLVVFLVIYQIWHYSHNIAHTPFWETHTNSAGDKDMLSNIIRRMGVTEELDHIVLYLRTLFFDRLYNEYMLSGFLMLYGTFYLAVTNRSRKLNSNFNLPSFTYLLLFVPSCAYSLLLMQADAYGTHQHSSLKFGLALSVSFAFAPIFFMQMMRKNYLKSAINLTSQKSISVATLLAVVASLIYAYVQCYDRDSLFKRFTPPIWKHVVVGDFVRRNTKYQDVIFSSDYFMRGYRYDYFHFPDKVIHEAYNLNQVYHKTREIKKSFTIKILYLQRRQQEMQKLSAFLTSQDFFVDKIQGEEVGWLLAFNGQQFLNWYEQVHQCDKYPQRCISDKAL